MNWVKELKHMAPEGRRRRSPVMSDERSGSFTDNRSLSLSHFDMLSSSSEIVSRLGTILEGSDYK